VGREITVKLDDADFRRIEAHIDRGIGRALARTGQDGREVVTTTVAAARAVMNERGVGGDDADAIAKAIQTHLAQQLHLTTTS
jgi:hypothetical protein